jgi:PPOX class probable F420-dependent enzyme
MQLSDLTALSAPESGLVIVATSRADGSIQSSLVNAGPIPHPVTGAEVLAYVTYGRTKLANLRRRPWTTITARAGWRWAAVEGTVEIAGPDDPLPGVDPEAIPKLLRDIFVAAGGSHDDWDEYDATMVRDRRAAVLVTPTRLYSNGR